MVPGRFRTVGCSVPENSARSNEVPTMQALLLFPLLLSADSGCPLSAAAPAVPAIPLCNAGFVALVRHFRSVWVAPCLASLLRFRQFHLLGEVIMPCGRCHVNGICEIPRVIHQVSGDFPIGT